MANDLISGPAQDSETGEQRPALWRRFVAGCDTHWPIRWPMANGIVLILLVGWLVPLVPEALSALGQNVGSAWAWLRLAGDGSTAPVTNAETIRNLSLTVSGPLALIALWLAWRRTFDARRQTETQIRQSQTQIEQARTAERAQQSDRFEVAIQNLVSGKTAPEITAVETLDQLRRANPENYEMTVIRTLANCISGMGINDNKSASSARFQNESAVNHRIWEIILDNNTADGVNPYSHSAKIYSTKCPVYFVNIFDFGNMEFHEVEFDTITISDSIRNTYLFKCKIRNIRIEKENIRMDFHFWCCFSSCTIGSITFSDGIDVDEEVTTQLFDECEYWDGVKVVYPLRQ